MDIESATLFLDGLVDQAVTADDYALIGTLHVIRQFCEIEETDTSKLGVICRAAEYICELRINTEPPRSAPGCRVRLRSRATHAQISP
jgi:hypothetical protein